MRVGTRIDDEGVLLSEGGEIFFRRNGGGRYQLDLRRVAVDLARSRARVIGVYVGNDLIDVDEIQIF